MKIILNFIVKTALLIFIVSLVVFVVESTNNQNMVVTVTVEPTRVIIVDNSLTIQRIISNTTVDTRPIVYLNSEDGLEIPYSESIMRQYMFLKPSLNFSQAGAIYDRDNRIPIAFIKLIIRTFKKVIGMPF